MTVGTIVWTPTESVFMLVHMWSCECGHRWRAAGAVHACPECSSSKIVGTAETAGPGGPHGVTRAPEMTVDHPGQRPPPRTREPDLPPTMEPHTQVWSGDDPPAAAKAVPGVSPTLSLPPTPGGRAETKPKHPFEPAFLQPAARPRSRLEDYELLGILGRGGMGVVHKARHLKLGRLVALKMILAGSHAGEAQLARFQTEAEAVARLQHPNIVQIYDIGEHDDQPFFALEYVDGGSLQQKLDGTPLPARPAAEMAVTLARAVDYAHQRGIVHRDLKPANILLQNADSKSPAERQANTPPDQSAFSSLQSAIPKITDFGLAKRTDDASGYTGTGDILGTPSYMSPEQATGRNQTVGPAADIYSLGAILYDLLTGRPPFRGETVLDTLQQVQEREPLPPTRFQPKVPSDLETICLKCLEKNPAKRYASAAAMANDLQRFLDDQPILARPTPWWERIAKWARRRPAVAALVATLAVVLTGAFIGMFLLWRDAEGERLAAVKASEESERQKLGAIAARDDAQRQRDRAEKNLQQAFLAGDELLTRVAQERLLKVPQMEGLRRDLLEKAKGFYERFYAVEGGTPAVRYQVARANRRIGDVLELLGKRTEARTAYERTVALLADLNQDAPQNRDYRHELASTHLNLGIVLQAVDQPVQAEGEYLVAQVLLDKLHQDYPLDVDYQRELAATSNSLAVLYQSDPGRGQDANLAYRKAIDWWRKLHDESPKDRDYQAELARVLNNFGGLLLSGSKRAEAEQAYVESLALWTDLAHQEPDQPLFADGRASALINVAVVWESANPATAEESYRQAAGFAEKLVQDYPRVADYRHNLARSYTNLGLLLGRDKNRTEEAAELGRKAIPHWEQLIEQDPQFADYQTRLIGCLQEEAKYQLSLRDTDQAIVWTEAAIDKRTQQVAAFPKRTAFQVALAGAYLDLGQLYGKKGQGEKEDGIYRQVLKLLLDIPNSAQRTSPGWAQTMADVHYNLGALRGERRQLPEALPWLQKAVNFQREALQLEKTNGSAQHKLARYALVLTNVQVELKDHVAATATAADVEPVLQQMPGAKGIELVTLARLVARCLPMSSGADQQKYSDRVVSLLQAAVGQGFSNANALQDPLFLPLQGRSDYDRLVRQLEKR